MLPDSLSFPAFRHSSTSIPPSLPRSTVLHHYPILRATPIAPFVPRTSIRVQSPSNTHCAFHIPSPSILPSIHPFDPYLIPTYIPTYTQRSPSKPSSCPRGRGSKPKRRSSLSSPKTTSLKRSKFLSPITAFDVISALELLFRRVLSYLHVYCTPPPSFVLSHRYCRCYVLYCIVLCCVVSFNV